MILLVLDSQRANLSLWDGFSAELRSALQLGPASKGELAVKSDAPVE